MIRESAGPSWACRRSAPGWFRGHDVHVHVPRGQCRRTVRRRDDGDGDRLLVRDEPVSADVGMTGELTLSGQVPDRRPAREVARRGRVEARDLSAGERA